MADAMQSGWHAEVNGVSKSLVAADHALVAVPIPAGSSSVILEYRPPGLQAGVRLSMMSAALVVLLAFWAARRKRAFQKSESDSSSVLP